MSMTRPLLIAAALLCLQISAPGVAADDERRISLGQVKASVLKADGSTESSQTGQVPTQLLSQDRLTASHSLEVSLSPQLGDGSSTRPQQVMLLLSHVATPGLAAYVVGKFKKDGSYTITATFPLIEKQIGKKDGKYDVTLLVGDPSVPSGVQYLLGSVNWDVNVTANSTAPPVRTALLQPLNNIKPEITHIFRPAQKRPPAIVSLVFTGLVWVPLAGVIVAALAYGVNLKGFPSDGAGLAALVFHGTLLAFMTLYLAFWLRMNLKDTLPLALMLGVVLFVSGHFALRGIASGRLKKD